MGTVLLANAVAMSAVGVAWSIAAVWMLMR